MLRIGIKARFRRENVRNRRLTMLHSYAATSFQSFKDRVVVDFVVNQRAPDTDWISTCATGQRVSKVMAVMGAHGAGKTALLKSG